MPGKPPKNPSERPSFFLDVSLPYNGFQTLDELEKKPMGFKPEIDQRVRKKKHKYIGTSIHKHSISCPSVGLYQHLDLDETKVRCCFFFRTFGWFVPSKTPRCRLHSIWLVPYLGVITYNPYFEGSNTFIFHGFWRPKVSSMGNPSLQWLNSSTKKLPAVLVESSILWISHVFSVMHHIFFHPLDTADILDSKCDWKGTKKYTLEMDTKNILRHVGLVMNPMAESVNKKQLKQIQIWWRTLSGCLLFVEVGNGHQS